MIINSSFKRLIIILTFVFLFPLIQRQWFNLYLFNTNSYSFYSILYYFSGIITPILVIFNSITKFTYYKFNNNIRTNSYIEGKRLLLIVLLTLIALSFLIANYLYINIDLIFNLFFDGSFSPNLTFINNIGFILILFVLLIFKQTKIFIKKIFLANFFVVSLISWHININNILTNEKFLINNYLSLDNINLNIDNINLINVLFLFTIEIIFYLWSFISYKNNLSNWSVYMPSINNFLNILNIAIFHSLIILYYSFILKLK